MAIFTNQATLSYNGVTTQSNITTGQIVQTLSAAKNTAADSYVSGENITYAVSLVNSGTAPFTGLTLTDDLGAYQFGDAENPLTLYPLSYVSGSVLYYVNGVLQPAPAVTAGPPLEITGISVPAGGNAVIVYEAQVNGFAPGGEGSEITNTVTVTGGGLAEAVTASDTLGVSDQPRLTITKDLSPESVAENGLITYTFTISNFSSAPAAAGDNAAVTDLFDPALENISVTFNGETWTAPTDYTYDETTGLFATVPGRITVPAATFTQDADTGAWNVTPGVSVLRVTGTV